jgi:hypothetical protein
MRQSTIDVQKVKTIPWIETGVRIRSDQIRYQQPSYCMIDSRQCRHLLSYFNPVLQSLHLKSVPHYIRTPSQIQTSIRPPKIVYAQYVLPQMYHQNGPPKPRIRTHLHIRTCPSPKCSDLKRGDCPLYPYLHLDSRNSFHIPIPLEMKLSLPSESHRSRPLTCLSAILPPKSKTSWRKQRVTSSKLLPTMTNPVIIGSPILGGTKHGPLKLPLKSYFPGTVL